MPDVLLNFYVVEVLIIRINFFVESFQNGEKIFVFLSHFLMHKFEINIKILFFFFIKNCGQIPDPKVSEAKKG